MENIASQYTLQLYNFNIIIQFFYIIINQDIEYHIYDIFLICSKNSRICFIRVTEQQIIIIHTISVCEKSTMECSKNQQLEDIAVNGNNASKAAFPWLPKFNKMIHSSTGSKNYQLLEQSLLFYIQ